MDGFLAVTSTTVVSVHKGAVLPIARFIVVAVPLTLLTAYLIVSARRGRR